ncbi:carbon-nitrogen hydrolase family protein [Chromobacterium sp. IIBBL 290-4]|uniref:carbon-nitrogen hydrolase family protein n=1 Tax=Chromobacterium sp. IIBBL 290-4 TaxID=2953890 RepID=UPI0020B8ED1E|nr:carbon-nitrogen hydrolase family protein [Chromobacterium sp. IIBBL 290-4]UTH73299.1 carbon-nitrogen hydrolase family protein [Chromobacterium sp. IIBBL 290-4]
MKQKFVAAAVQMVSGCDVDANLARADQLLAEAARHGAQLAALPEYFCLMGAKDTDKVAAREAFGNGPIQQALADMARRHKLWLLGGTAPLAGPEPDKVLNSSLLFSPAGEVCARYDKIHLFGFSGQGESYCESNTITPGDTPIKAETPLADIALGICYDLRFPEQFRLLSPFDLLILPAAFTATTGEAHWEPLLRTRAIENQCYVLATAQGGLHENGRRTHGHSMIIDPWGRIVAELPQGEGVITAEIDPELIHSVRDRLPALSHRVIR